MRNDEPIFRDALFRNKKKKSGYRIVEIPQPALEAAVADTHAHLDMLRDVPLVLARCAAQGLEFICSIIDIHEDKGKVYQCGAAWREEAALILPEIIQNTKAELAEAGEPVAKFLATTEDFTDHIPSIRIVAGCHPHNAKHYNDDLEVALIEKLHDPRTCAVGEVGLDYHYDFSPRDQQREAFRRQIRLAHLSGLPLVLHLREAHEEALEIMEEEGFPAAGTVLHCFNLDFETLEPWLAHDCYVAFGGPLTFKNSDETRKAASKVPVNRLLTETDAPFMTPEPMRGMVCSPEHTIFTAAKLAEVFGCTPGKQREEFLQQVFDNALELLDREPTDWQLFKDSEHDR